MKEYFSIKQNKRQEITEKIKQILLGKKILFLYLFLVLFERTFF